MHRIRTRATHSYSSKAGKRTAAARHRRGDPQEILHRYVAINRRDAIQPAFDALLGVVDEVLGVDEAAAERAKEIVLGHRNLSARDALHLAVMEQHGVEQILSFDSGFDGFPGVTRLFQRAGVGRFVARVLAAACV